MAILSDRDLAEMREFVRARLEPMVRSSADNNGSFRGNGRFRWEHTLRVLKIAKEIAKTERADWSVVSAATVFHDVAKLQQTEQDHAKVGAQIAQEYLTSRSYSAEWVQQVCQVIECHSLPDPGDLLEARVLWDADRLDETGAVGIVWSCINSGRSAAPSYEDAVYRITQYDLRHVELLVGRMKTETGKEIARERVAIIQSFVEELAREGVGRDGAGSA